MESIHHMKNKNKSVSQGTEQVGSRLSVTVIGLGPMGKAIVGAFLDKGYEVTVWNRTLSKADDLMAKGAMKASTVSEAITSNDLIVLSLTDYRAMYAIFEPISGQLTGKVIVNLSSDTPEKVREASEWLAERNAVQLTGGVLASPPGIGNKESVTLYSGPRKTFDDYQNILEVLTSTSYKGEDPGLAMLYYQLQIDVFWTAMLSNLHAVAVARANGITAEQLLPYVSDILSTMPKLLEFYAPRIDAGTHSGDVEKLAMGLASVEHVVQTSNEAGIDASLPAAVLDVFKRGVARGHAGDSFTSLIDMFQKH